MSQIVSFWDDTLKKYLEVSDTNPLPTSAVGGGAGGSEQVTVTGAGGDASTGTGNADAQDGTSIGLLTNARNYGYNGATWDRLKSTSGVLQVIQTGALPAGTNLIGKASISNDGTNNVAIQQGNIDAYLATDYVLMTGAHNLLYNSASSQFERQRNNTASTLLSSAARTATTSSLSQTNYNARGAVIFLEITSNPGGAETLSFGMEYINPVTGTASMRSVKMDVPAATNGVFTLQVYPGTLDTPENPTNNGTYSMMVPRTWRSTVVHSGSGSWTYSLGCSLLL